MSILNQTTKHFEPVAIYGKHEHEQAFLLMEAKQSNLCVSADVGTAKELLELADKVQFV
jgi:uncharacterized protein YaiI (UPF0178 family)